YLGRADFQVKVRGVRIELGEIEARLLEHPAVREAVVVAGDDDAGEKRLVAYYVVSPGAERPGAEALAHHAGDSLPEHLVPAAWVELEQFPLTPNGKLDRKALPAPDRAADARPPYEAPQDETEIAIAALWAELLGVERV